MSTTALLLVAAAGVAALLVLVTVFKVQAFVALLLVSIVVAIAGGVPVGEVIATVEEGMGGTLGGIAIIIGLGAIIGQIVQESGGGVRVARTLIDRFGEQRAPLALGLTGFVIAIPVFFDVGLIILIPLVYAIARRLRRSLLFYAIPLLAGLAVTHSFIPPTPGPVAVAGIIGADLGWVILWGLVCGLPAFIVGGVVFGRLVGTRMDVSVPEYMLEEMGDEAEGDDAPPPPFGLIVSVILLPLALILAQTWSQVALEEGNQLRAVLSFVGDPITALLFATLLTMYVLGVRRGWEGEKVQNVATAALQPVGLVLLVTGAGGVFGAVLEASGIGDALQDVLDASGLPLIVAAFLIAVAVRVALGSATAAAVAAAGLVAPLVEGAGLSAPFVGLVVIAIAAGATVLSHVNDSGFWLVNTYLGLSVPETLKTWTVMETLIGVVGFAVAFVLSLFV